MPSLKTLQTLFCQNLIEEESDILPLLSSSLPKERLQIYRSNVFHNICQALKLTFPGTVHLLGNEGFEKLTTLMLCDQSFWPKSGCLDDFGEEWCHFMRQSEFGKEYPNVCDFCEYEWQKSLAASLPHQDIFIPDLSHLDTTQLLDIRFQFVPSCLLFHSEYAIDHIEAYVSDQTTEECPDRYSYAIIIKTREITKTIWLNYETWIFIYLLYHENSLLETVQHLKKENITFDMHEALTLIFKEKLAHTILPE